MSTSEIVGPPETIKFPPKQTKNILDKACFLSISRGWPSLSKALPKEFIKVEKGDNRRFHGQKDLYKANVLTRMINNETRLDLSLDRLCLPFPLKRGVRLLPLDLVEEVIEKTLKEHVEARNKLIAEFEKDYNKIVLESQEFLGAAFNPADYPPVELVVSEFTFEWDILQINPAEQLQKVRKEYFQREVEKMAKRSESAGQAIEQLLCASMAELINHVVDRLSTEEGQKKKVFRDTLMDPITEFLRTLPARNITDNNQLNELADKVQMLLNGVDPKNLRTNEGLKSTVLQGFNEIKAKLDTMVQVSPKRAITFED